MATLPTVNRRDVTAAPIRTSRHPIVVSGMNLKISANRTAIMPKEKTTFTDCKRRTDKGNKVFTNLSAADKEALITSDASKRKPVAMTKPSEKNRCLNVIIQKLWVLLSTLQIVLS